jgi:hypothetical protein
VKIEVTNKLAALGLAFGLALALVGGATLARAGGTGTSATRGTISGLVRVREDSTFQSGNGYGDAGASCPAGKKLLGGGFKIVRAGVAEDSQGDRGGLLGGGYVWASFPSDANDRWVVRFRAGSYGAKVEAFALCANPGS